MLQSKLSDMTDATWAERAVLIVLLRPLLQRYALARPNARSSHVVPTPQGAGIAVIGAWSIDLESLGVDWVRQPAGPRPKVAYSGETVGLFDQAARIAFMAASYSRDDVAFAAGFDGFCATAGLNELIALCRGLPVYPAAKLLEPSALEAMAKNPNTNRREAF